MHHVTAVAKPTDLHAPGALEQLFAYNRQQFGGWVMEDTGSGDGSDGSDGADGADDQGDGGGDLGFPPDTPVSEMTDDQKAAYNRHQREKNREQTRKWKSVTGDRTPEQLQAELQELQDLRKSKLTDSERAVEDAKADGRREGVTLGNRNAVKAIFEAALDDQHSDDDVADLVGALNVDAFINDAGEINTKKLKDFAKKFVPAGSTAGDQQRRRDFGGGTRGEGTPTRGAAGKAEAQRRFGAATS